MTTCSHHDGLCAYRGDEHNRCAFCHASWPVILSTGYHSCEVATIWPAQMRGLRIAQVRRAQESTEALKVPSSSGKWILEGVAA